MMALPPRLLELLERAEGITHRSAEVSEGYIFFALRGRKHDGHDFVGEALARGALAAVVEKGAEGDRVIRVPSTRMALAESAHTFFGRPSERLSVIGVTGTNGKTSTVYLIEKILRRAGFRPGSIGTLGYRFGDRTFGEGRTTPDAVVWHGTLKGMLESGATHVVAEVSSHALDQFRVWGTAFEAVIFTNLTRDHLDYHRTMEDYFRAKERLFTEYSYRLALVNTDDPYGKRLADTLGPRAVTYGREGDMRIEGFETDFGGSEIRLLYRGKRYRFRTPLIGDFQAYNIASAVLCALEMGVEEEVIGEALAQARVPGRFEIYSSSDDFLVVVDYAHTPDAVENVLRTVRKLARRRVITVFGAGGDRDREKRPMMGESAERWSDLIFVTSDNPRSEDPARIAEDIVRGIRNRGKVVVELDRKRAIERALEIAGRGDVVAVLGKGHENFQEVKGVKYPFSDSEVIMSVLRGGRNALRL